MSKQQNFYVKYVYLVIYCNAFGDMKGHQGTLVYILLNRSLVVLSIILICCTLVVKEFIIQKMYSYTCKLFVILRARYTYIKVAAQNVAWWGYVSVSAICLKLMSNLRRLQLIRLSLSENITAVTRTCSFFLYNIRRIRPFLTTYSTQFLVQAMVLSRLDYWNSLLAGLPASAIRRLQLIKNAAFVLGYGPLFFPMVRGMSWAVTQYITRYSLV